MKNVTGGLVDPHCLATPAVCNISGVGTGRCDGIYYGSEVLCGCTINGTSYETSACSRF